VSRVFSKYNALKQYKWGADCIGWNLVDEAALSVKQELMPAGTSEVKHYHSQVQPFFYILKGAATFEIENIFTQLKAGEGVPIRAGERHRIHNDSHTGLEFILCSQPSTAADRTNCD
jgi:mannose-6-phosphate isomerase-like protein (cupin superfamily)